VHGLLHFAGSHSGLAAGSAAMETVLMSTLRINRPVPMSRNEFAILLFTLPFSPLFLFLGLISS
jgi:hypothetical protein